MPRIIREKRILCNTFNNVIKQNRKFRINNIAENFVDMKYFNKVKFMVRSEFRGDFRYIVIKRVVHLLAVLRNLRFIGFLFLNVSD